MSASAVDGLAGIRVIDFGQYVAGPLLGVLLGNEGADVVHIDPPGGPRHVRGQPDVPERLQGVRSQDRREFARP